MVLSQPKCDSYLFDYDQVSLGVKKFNCFLLFNFRFFSEGCRLSPGIHCVSVFLPTFRRECSDENEQKLRRAFSLVSRGIR